MLFFGRAKYLFVPSNFCTALQHSCVLNFVLTLTCFCDYQAYWRRQVGCSRSTYGGGLIAAQKVSVCCVHFIGTSVLVIAWFLLANCTFLLLLRKRYTYTLVCKNPAIWVWTNSNVFSQKSQNVLKIMSFRVHMTTWMKWTEFWTPLTSGFGYWIWTWYSNNKLDIQVRMDFAYAFQQIF
jgi:hypothetical protein